MMWMTFHIDSTIHILKSTLYPGKIFSQKEPGWYSFRRTYDVHLKTILLKISRFIGWTLFGVFVLLITAILLVRVPSIQNKIAQKAIAYLEDKIKTDVALKSITIN